ncbi:MAG: hypothetical protein ACFE8P_14145 [Promethearchaeota archaeon]
MAIIDSIKDGRIFATNKGSIFMMIVINEVKRCNNGHPDTSELGLITK